jgi:ABC-2 type transporter
MFPVISDQVLSMFNSVQHALTVLTHTSAAALCYTFTTNNTQVFAESAILLHRNFRNVLRTPELFFVRVGLCVVMGLVLGSLFWNVKVSNGSSCIAIE